MYVISRCTSTDEKVYWPQNADRGSEIFDLPKLFLRQFTRKELLYTGCAKKIYTHST